MPVLGSRVPNSPHGLCGRKVTLNSVNTGSQELCESRGGRPGLPVHNRPDGLCGRKATLNRAVDGGSMVVLPVSLAMGPVAQAKFYNPCGVHL